MGFVFVFAFLVNEFEICCRLDFCFASRNKKWIKQNYSIIWFISSRFTIAIRCANSAKEIKQQILKIEISFIFCCH